MSQADTNALRQELEQIRSDMARTRRLTQAVESRSDLLTYIKHTRPEEKTRPGVVGSLAALDVAGC